MSTGGPEAWAQRFFGAQVVAIREPAPRAALRNLDAACSRLGAVVCLTAAGHGDDRRRREARTDVFIPRLRHDWRGAQRQADCTADGNLAFRDARRVGIGVDRGGREDGLCTLVDLDSAGRDRSARAVVPGGPGTARWGEGHGAARRGRGMPRSRTPDPKNAEEAGVNGGCTPSSGHGTTRRSCAGRSWTNDRDRSIAPPGRSRSGPQAGSRRPGRRPGRDAAPARRAGR